jgi:hypothetical protein
MSLKPCESRKLAEWLEIATKGIAVSGKERITREIEVHYAEAVESHIAKGEPEPVAQANALGDLGDPMVAGKSFRKKHLTEKEATVVQRLQNESGSVRWLLFDFLFAPFLLLIIHPVVDHSPLPVPAWNWVCLIVTFAILPIIRFRVARRADGKPILTVLLAISLLQSIGFCILFLLFFKNSSPPAASWLMLPIFVFKQRHLPGAWKKIRKHENPAIGT